MFRRRSRTILERGGHRAAAQCRMHQPRAKRGDEIAVGVDCAEERPKSIGSHLLLAVGRRPNTDDLGLDKAGVATDEQGYIMVDDQLRTNVPGIWALGDCNGKGAFTHTAYNDFEIVAANMLDGETRRVSDRITAYGLYIDPPLGRVGMTETEVRKWAARRWSATMADEARRPRLREERDARLHEDPRRRRDEEDPRRLDPRHRRRRG